MIKSITIQSFEAHDDTTVHFGEGMNSIVGLSNSGKSAIIRALMVVVGNEWDKDMVRTGSEFCRVKVETERGWVEAERGEKVNRWRCQEGNGEIQIYQKVGTSVPELATKILGMGKKDRGNGISEFPNFQTQLEKHYMLSEVGEKKATSNVIALMMDNAIGLGGMEDLIKDFSSDLLKDKKWLNEKQEEIVTLKSDIMDEMIFIQYENEIKKIGKLKDRIESMDSDISTADVYYGKYLKAKEGKEKAEEMLASMPDVDAMKGLAEDVDTIKKGISLVEEALSKTGRLAVAEVISGIDVATMEGVANGYDEIDGRIENGERLLEVVGNCERRLEASGRIAGIDCDAMEALQSEINALNTRIGEAEKKLSDARDVWKRHNASDKKDKSLASELKSSETEFENLKKELGVCPLCGNKL